MLRLAFFHSYTAYGISNLIAVFFIVVKKNANGGPVGGNLMKVPFLSTPTYPPPANNSDKIKATQ